MKWRLRALRVKTEQLEEVVRERTAEIVKKNDVLERQKYEIKNKNADLEQKQEEIKAQNVHLSQTLKELHNTQNQLVEAEKMASLGNLVAGVAHEINTPVGIGVTSASSVMHKTDQFTEKFKTNKLKKSDLAEFITYIKQNIKLILSNLERTADLVKSFKQVSVDHSVEDLREFKLNTYLHDIINTLKPKFRRTNVTVDIQCDENIELNSYPGVFAQIFTNFVINSLIHGFGDTKEGEIKIGAEVIENKLHLSYSDTGKGILKEILPKIFDPFFTTNKQTGTGLGMNIVYNLVKQKLSGEISCESEVGKGAHFKIVIPYN